MPPLSLSMKDHVRWLPRGTRLTWHFTSLSKLKPTTILQFLKCFLSAQVLCLSLSFCWTWLTPTNHSYLNSTTHLLYEILSNPHIIRQSTSHIFSKHNGLFLHSTHYSWNSAVIWKNYLTYVFLPLLDYKKLYLFEFCIVFLAPRRVSTWHLVGDQ